MILWREGGYHKTGLAVVHIKLEQFFLYLWHQVAFILSIQITMIVH